jgi:hypothetical protein
LSTQTALPSADGFGVATLLFAPSMSDFSFIDIVIAFGIATAVFVVARLFLTKVRWQAS